MIKPLFLRMLIMCLFFLFPAVGLAEKSETLLGVRIDPGKKVFSMDVLSGGCTEKRHFRFDRTGNEMIIVRTERDACKALPHRITLEYTFDEVGIRPDSPFRIRNSIDIPKDWE